MSLIDSSYFIGEIAIPNIDQRINTIQSNIDKYEKEVLICLLGQKLFDEFIAALADNPAQKWLDLRDGKEFILPYNGHDVTLKWNGFINSDKISLIAYYVYYKIRYEELSTTTSIGETRGKVENSELVNETRKMLNAWRKFLHLYGELVYSENGINYQSWNFGELRGFRNSSGLFFDKYSDTYDTYNDLPSAFNFINVNRADYDDWVLTPKINMNEFGI